LSRDDAALGWVGSAADLVKLMIKYKNVDSLHTNVGASQRAFPIDRNKTTDVNQFDWCSIDSTRDWWGGSLSNCWGAAP